jgi:hypothetical protein
MTFLFIFLTAAILGTFAIWSRKDTRIRLGAVILFGTLGLWIVESVRRSYSYPSPYISNITVPSGKWNVIAYNLDYGKHIYVWLYVEGVPRSYSLPWNIDQAVRLQGSLGENGVMDAEDEGLDMVVPDSFGDRENTDDLFIEATPSHNDIKKN